MAQPFQPSLKERKRYVVYEPAGDADVLAAYTELFGMHGAASAGITPVEQHGSRSVLRCAHTAVDRVKAALVWTGRQSVTTSGTLKNAKNALTTP